ncbi:hypothetical protein [Ruegeria arenilitoris]|uniref:hypothetical protein n=1 Tax=Ruegeria arenilitoris TaxID=1173585 RepID=UPI001C2C3737|nr:hypothetical protein [Ruegeria arenilitoris]
MKKWFNKLKLKLLQWLLRDYVTAHLADKNWHDKQFDYISDDELATRLSEEFMSARYIYKVLRALEAGSWLRNAQVRVQVLMYASVYEAALHHVLFQELSDNPRVQQLTEYKTLKRISLPKHSMQVLEKNLSHDGKDIIPSYQDVARTDITKVRFDAKARCAAELGIINSTLCDDLIEIYEARNAIHIHAEIKKSLKYELKLAEKAYRRMKPFNEQLRKFCNSHSTVGPCMEDVLQKSA